MTTRTQQLHHWLSLIIDVKDYQLRPASDDASFRRYFRLTFNDETYIVMDAPPTKEDCGPYINIAGHLLAAGINVPRVIEKNLEQGFLLLSDLGDEQYLEQLAGHEGDMEIVDGLYEDAMQVILCMQQQVDKKGLPPYDEKLLRQEMYLFTDWLLEKHIGMSISKETRLMLEDVFKLLVDEAMAQPRVFVHRDYHSRNLMVNGAGSVKGNPGVLDFQDAVCGPITYDLVSLLKDCYIKWPAQRVQDWANIFFQQLVQGHPDIDAGRFMRWFDLMGAQRHLKASGIFARLYHRDGKSGYLADIPRTLSYIVDLKHDYPELGGLIALIEDCVVTSPEMKLTAEADNSCGP